MAGDSIETKLKQERSQAALDRVVKSGGKRVACAVSHLHIPLVLPPAEWSPGSVLLSELISGAISSPEGRRS